MRFLIEHATELTFALLVLIVLVNLCLVALVFIRRGYRRRYFERLDHFRSRYDPVISGLISGRLEYAQGIAELKQLDGPDPVSMIERLCLNHSAPVDAVPVLRRICEDLGLVEIWQYRLIGGMGSGPLRERLHDPEGLMGRIRRLQLVKARSAEALGRIRHEPSWPLLVKALADPSPDLQMASARALGSIGHPASFPALMRRLEEAVVGPGILSLRSLKSALIHFPSESARFLLPLLENPNARIRSAAIEVINGMAQRETAIGNGPIRVSERLGSEIAEILLGSLATDPDPEVRARVASALAYIDDKRTAPVLLKLIADPVWFVRLRGVRSLAGSRFLPWSGQIAVAVTDDHWRVREAAVRTLRGLGDEGLKRLIQLFLSTDDRYSREQIADELQRAGLIPELVKQWSVAQGSPEASVIEQMAAMGKTSYICSTALDANGDSQIRRKFLESFGEIHDSAVAQHLHIKIEPNGDK